MRLLTHAELLEVVYENELVVRRQVARTTWRAGRFVKVRVAYEPTGLSVPLRSRELSR